MSEQKKILEPAKEVPVMAEVDVLVVGGGPAGVGAALAAAREGARTLLLEQMGCLGGMWTSGLVNPIFDKDGKGWVVDDMLRELQERGFWHEYLRAGSRNFYTFDVEGMIRLLDDMAVESGCRILFFTKFASAIVDNGQVCGAFVEHKGGRGAILAKTVIDCSGDGDAAASAGATFDFGRAEDGLSQPMTLMFEVDGCKSYVQNSAVDLYEAMLDVIEKRGLDTELKFAPPYAPWLLTLPRDGRRTVQATHAYKRSGINPWDITEAVIDCRRQVWELVELMKHIDGFDNPCISRTGTLPGVRETRRIHGEYRLEAPDLIEGRSFDDGITNCSFLVDIHAPDLEKKHQSHEKFKVKPYQIPYRSLIPKGLSGILIAGRCISGSHEANASYRVTGTCMGMGQAAGLAGAMAARNNCDVREIDGVELKQALISRGANL